MTMKEKSKIGKVLCIENYEDKRKTFLEEGYTEYKKTISVLKANVMAMVTTTPFVVVAVYISWGLGRICI